MKTIPGASATLSLLMNYAKKSNPDFSISALRNVLAAQYTVGMPYPNVVYLVSACWLEATQQPKFQLGSSDILLRETMLAPVRGEFRATADADPQALMSIEQFYGSMLKRMMTDLSAANIAWTLEPEASFG